MLFSLFAFLVGHVSYVCQEPLKCVNLLASLSVSSYAFHVKDNRAHFRCLLFSDRRVRKALAAQGIAVESCRLGGLPGFFYRYRLRLGAFLGAFICVALTVLSGRFVWQIDVVGNSRLSDAEVLSMLAAEGVYEGAYIQNIDPLAAANRCVMHNDSLSYMSVNLVGNRVEAVVNEQDDKVIEEGNTSPSNVVAARDGVVKAVELSAGVALVKEGSVVKAGQLLISGVNQLRNESWHYQPAKGRVWAETYHVLTLEESVQSEEKVYTGRVFYEKTYIFFTKSKKVSQDSGNLPANCDRIETKERVMLFGRIPLPLWIRCVSYREFVYQERQRSEAEVKAALLEKASALYREGELVSKEEAFSFDGEKGVLTLRYRLIEDIAQDLMLFETP